MNDYVFKAIMQFTQWFIFKIDYWPLSKPGNCTFLNIAHLGYD